MVLELAVAYQNGRALTDEIERASGVRVDDCYQCGKCTAGCPLSFAMDLGPRQIMRLLQLGLGEEALRAHAPWLCAGCLACAVRCPQGVEVARVMEALRILAKERGPVPERQVDLFGDLFLASVARYGRVDELGLSVRYNLGSGRWFKDAALAPALFRHGKVRLRPAAIAGRGAIKEIFNRCRRRGGLAR